MKEIRGTFEHVQISGYLDSLPSLGELWLTALYNVEAKTRKMLKLK